MKQQLVLLVLVCCALCTVVPIVAKEEKLKGSRNSFERAVGGRLSNDPPATLDSLTHTVAGAATTTVVTDNNGSGHDLMLVSSDAGEYRTRSALADANRELVFNLKADVIVNQVDRHVSFSSFNGRVSGLQPKSLIRNAIGLKPLTLDFKISNQKKQKFQQGRGGAVAVEISSEYLDAVFGFNFDEKLHNNENGHKDHASEKHQVHEYSSTTLPGTLHFRSLAIDLPKNGANAEDGTPVDVKLVGLVLVINPRSEHKTRGVRDTKLSIGGFVTIPTRSLLVPVDTIRPGHWTVPDHFKWGRFQLKRNICLQPVRVVQRRCSFRMPSWMGGFCFWWQATHYSGAGLAFGKPQADKEWGKVDITFTWRTWHTIVDYTGKYKSITSGAEETDLKNLVDDDDCIEIFFVESFTPEDLHGGGACWSGGQAHSKIITSDENADCGVDLTHLAHELGHVLNLKHPGGATSTRPAGTAGTLMCGSGWERDNPKRQSQENGDNAANPLLTSYLAYTPFFISSSPDCVDSSDCGTCSEHLLNEPCV